MVTNMKMLLSYILDKQFATVKLKIIEKYKSTEKELLTKFRNASQQNNVEEMQQMAETLSSYQHYQHCVDAFIEQSVKELVEQGMNEDIFKQIEGKFQPSCVVDYH